MSTKSHTTKPADVLAKEATADQKRDRIESDPLTIEELLEFDERDRGLIGEFASCFACAETTAPQLRPRISSKRSYV